MIGRSVVRTLAAVVHLVTGAARALRG